MGAGDAVDNVDGGDSIGASPRGAPTVNVGIPRESRVGSLRFEWDEKGAFVIGRISRDTEVCGREVL